MVLRIVKHGSAEAVLPVLAHQDVVVHTALATCPEQFILRKLRICHWFIAEIGVDLHYCKSCSEAEKFRIGVLCTRQFEDSLLDLLCNTALPEFRRDDEAGVGNILAVTPGFDIAESYPASFGSERDHGFSFINL